MALGSGQVHQTAFGQNVQPPAIAQHVLAIVGANLLGAHSELREVVKVDLAVVVAGVAYDRPVLHSFEMATGDHVTDAGGSDEYVAHGAGRVHGRHVEAFQRRFQRRDRIDFGHHDVRSKAARTLGHAASAVSVAGDDELLAGYQH